MTESCSSLILSTKGSNERQRSGNLGSCLFRSIVFLNLQWFDFICARIFPSFKKKWIFESNTAYSFMFGRRLIDGMEVGQTKYRDKSVWTCRRDHLPFDPCAVISLPKLPAPLRDVIGRNKSRSGILALGCQSSPNRQWGKPWSVRWICVGWCWRASSSALFWPATKAILR